MEHKFYMLYVEGRSSPTVKHRTYLDAKREAERLAKNNPGKDVYLLSALDRFSTTTVTRTALSSALEELGHQFWKS